MKKVTIILTGVILMALNAINVNAQNTVTATAETSATIITPIAISKVDDMRFGNIAVQSNLAGTVILSTAGVRTATGGVTLPVITGDFNSAVFEVTGEAGSAYTISLPDEILLSNGTANMTVNNFVSNPSGTGLIDGEGAQTINVGATLNVEAGQSVGLYENVDDLFVTVNYN